MRNLLVTSLLFALTLILLSSCISQVQAGSRCDSGFFQTICPDSHPVCCFQPISQIWAACCPLGSKCRLDEGVCITPAAAAANNSNNGSSNSSNAPGSSATQAPVMTTGGFDISVSLGAIIIAIVCVVMIVGIAAVIAIGMWAALRYDLHLMRQRQRAAGDGSSSNSSDGASSDGDNNHNGDHDADGDNSDAAGSAMPDNAECIICCSSRKNTVFLPCAHMIACASCAGRVFRENSICPCCRTPIRSVVRIRKSAPGTAKEV